MAPRFARRGSSFVRRSLSPLLSFPQFEPSQEKPIEKPLARSQSDVTLASSFLLDEITDIRRNQIEMRLKRSQSNASIATGLSL